MLPSGNQNLPPTLPNLVRCHFCDSQRTPTAERTHLKPDLLTHPHPSRSKQTAPNQTKPLSWIPFDPNQPLPSPPLPNLRLSCPFAAQPASNLRRPKNGSHKYTRTPNGWLMDIPNHSFSGAINRHPDRRVLIFEHLQAHPANTPCQPLPSVA